jgi:hypothetical protein
VKLLVIKFSPTFHPSLVQKISSAPCFQIPSVHALSLMSETKLHTHTKLQAKLQFCTVKFLCFLTADNCSMKRNLMRSVLSLNILLENPSTTSQKTRSFQKHQHKLSIIKLLKMKPYKTMIVSHYITHKVTSR